MKKSAFFLGIALLVLFLPGSGVFAQRNKQLVIYSWEGMFPQDILDAYTKATGYQVVLKEFVYNEDMRAEMEVQNGGAYDLSMGDDYMLEMVIDEGLVKKLDKSKLPNYRNIDPMFQGQYYDPNDDYIIPYGAGLQTIVYDPKKIKLNIRGFRDLWDPSLRGKIGMIANYRVVDGMALKALEPSRSYNADSVADIKLAGQKLNSLVPNIKVLQDDNLDELMLKGNISVALMYTDQVTKVKIEDPNLKTVFPREGLGFGIMGLFIPSNAPNPDAAYKFINFILDPRHGAECFEYLGYYCTYKASEQYIKSEYKPYLIMGNFGNCEMIENISQEAEDAHAQIWEDFTSRIKK